MKWYKILIPWKLVPLLGRMVYPSKLIKRVADDFSHPLTHMINVPFEEGVFSMLLKSSVVKPIYKKGSAVDINNKNLSQLLRLFQTFLKKYISGWKWLFFCR